MGWSIGYDQTWSRDIGYGVPAWCDHPGCTEEIDRGLSYVCGGQPYGGDDGCGLYFCGKHIYVGGPPQCERCVKPLGFDEDKDELPPPFKPKPDHPRWIEHKLTDPSWRAYRAANPEAVAKLRAQLPAPTGATPTGAESDE